MAATTMQEISCPRTDITRWRLTTTGGTHRWLYLSEEEAKKQPMSFAENYFLGLHRVALHLMET